MMPPSITDEDINALFAGFLQIIRKKQELDTKAEILNLNNDKEKLLKELKQKQAECVRLKNEIIFLKNKLAQQTC